MGIIKLECIEVAPQDGFGIVILCGTSTDSTISASGNIGFTIFDYSKFEVGKFYDLNLKEVL